MCFRSQGGPSPSGLRGRAPGPGWSTLCVGSPTTINVADHRTTGHYLILQKARDFTTGSHNLLRIDLAVHSLIIFDRDGAGADTPPANPPSCPPCGENSLPPWCAPVSRARRPTVRRRSEVWWSPVKVTLWSVVGLWTTPGR